MEIWDAVGYFLTHNIHCITWLGCCLYSMYWYVVLMFSWKFMEAVFLLLDSQRTCVLFGRNYLQIRCGNVRLHKRINDFQKIFLNRCSHLAGLMANISLFVATGCNESQLKIFVFEENSNFPLWFNPVNTILVRRVLSKIYFSLLSECSPIITLYTLIGCFIWSFSGCEEA